MEIGWSGPLHPRAGNEFVIVQSQDWTDADNGMSFLHLLKTFPDKKIHCVMNARHINFKYASGMLSALNITDEEQALAKKYPTLFGNMMMATVMDIKDVFEANPEIVEAMGYSQSPALLQLAIRKFFFGLQPDLKADQLWIKKLKPEHQGWFAHQFDAMSDPDTKEDTNLLIKIFIAQAALLFEEHGISRNRYAFYVRDETMTEIDHTPIGYHGHRLEIAFLFNTEELEALYESEELLALDYGFVVDRRSDTTIRSTSSNTEDISDRSSSHITSPASKQSLKFDTDKTATNTQEESISEPPPGSSSTKNHSSKEDFFKNRKRRATWTDLFTRHLDRLHNKMRDGRPEILSFDALDNALDNKHSVWHLGAAVTDYAAALQKPYSANIVFAAGQYGALDAAGKNNIFANQYNLELAPDCAANTLNTTPHPFFMFPTEGAKGGPAFTNRFTIGPGSEGEHIFLAAVQPGDQLRTHVDKFAATKSAGTVAREPIFDLASAIAFSALIHRVWPAQQMLLKPVPLPPVQPVKLVLRDQPTIESRRKLDLVLDDGEPGSSGGGGGKLYAFFMPGQGDDYRDVIGRYQDAYADDFWRVVRAALSVPRPVSALSSGACER